MANVTLKRGSTVIHPETKIEQIYDVGTLGDDVLDVATPTFGNTGYGVATTSSFIASVAGSIVSDFEIAVVGHTHAISDIYDGEVGLQSKIDGKVVLDAEDRIPLNNFPVVATQTMRYVGTAVGGTESSPASFQNAVINFTNNSESIIANAKSSYSIVTTAGYFEFGLTGTINTTEHGSGSFTASPDELAIAALDDDQVGLANPLIHLEEGDRIVFQAYTFTDANIEVTFSIINVNNNVADTVNYGTVALSDATVTSRIDLNSASNSNYAVTEATLRNTLKDNRIFQTFTGPGGDCLGIIPFNVFIDPVQWDSNMLNIQSALNSMLPAANTNDYVLVWQLAGLVTYVTFNGSTWDVGSTEPVWSDPSGIFGDTVHEDVPGYYGITWNGSTSIPASVVNVNSTYNTLTDDLLIQFD